MAGIIFWILFWIGWLEKLKGLCIGVVIVGRGMLGESRWYNSW